MTGLVVPIADGPAATEIVDRLRLSQRGLLPFSPEVVEFTGDLSRRLRKLGRVQALPALAALAYWIRPANIERLRSEWHEQTHRPDLVRLPRGVAFHIPPGNVDTLFVYSWLLSALAGNANVIRISQDALRGAEFLLEEISTALIDHPGVARTTSFVTYDRSIEVTGALSQSDVRLIWGGDDTVQAIRSVPCSPRTVELAFADRYSFALVKARPIANIEVAADLAKGLFNDAYWFNQLGCASPRALIWLGNELEVEAAADLLWSALAAEVKRKGYRSPEGVATAKLVHLTRVALTGDLAWARWLAGDVAVGHLSPEAALQRDSPGGGLFYSGRIDHTKELAELVQPQDQTLAYFGFKAKELLELAFVLGASGVDRMVPVGTALDFDRYWDGHDLLHSLTRIVRIA